MPMPAVSLRTPRSEEHTSELQSRQYLVCRLLLEKKKHDPRIEPQEAIAGALRYVDVAEFLNRVITAILLAEMAIQRRAQDGGVVPRALGMHISPTPSAAKTIAQSFCHCTCHLAQLRNTMNSYQRIIIIP